MRIRIVHGTHGMDVNGEAAHAHASRIRHGHASGAKPRIAAAPSTAENESAMRFTPRIAGHTKSFASTGERTRSGAVR